MRREAGVRQVDLAWENAALAEYQAALGSTGTSLALALMELGQRAELPASAPSGGRAGAIAATAAAGGNGDRAFVHTPGKTPGTCEDPMDEFGTHRGVALVTGAAGGIGREIAHALAAQGVAVALLDRDENGLAAVEAELRKEDALGVPYALDIADARSVGRAVADIEERLGGIDYLVNCAGVLRPGDAAELTEEDWAATFAVNATGTFVVSQAVVNRMTARRSGAVVTIASNAAHTPRAGMSAYCASKAAAAMFTKSLGLEVARHGIRCNVVAPGSTHTGMLTALWGAQGSAEATIAGSPDTYKTGIPLGRIAETRHIADAVLFLLSEKAAHITMQTLTVDGGATLGQ
ncbi:2,3-dihydro-2,3-dihydroxybenzoate dehydrogenase [Kitasatospora sp. NPDC058170]|uniref:2,3-dihydro-2,3-dihydroxybenzoate dehydrogenase n=1 Tax=Kitasatospora sp. NPDC058170 TaxID=3346364 RepID=UPI0036DF9946